MINKNTKYALRVANTGPGGQQAGQGFAARRAYRYDPLAPPYLLSIQCLPDHGSQLHVQVFVFVVVVRRILFLR
jgi:hypothetical protein